MMKAEEFVAKARLANDSKTLYILGCFGAPMNSKNKKRYSTNKAYNKKRADKINAASADTFGFDCICLIKGLLWGWNADTKAIYGGADYESNDVPDFGTETMLNYCTDVSDDFSKLEPGEVLWMEGHAGIVISDNLAIECTPIWEDGVQITAIGNVGKVKGYHTRTWKKHGKIKFVDYTKPEPVPVEPEPTPVVPEPTPVKPEPKSEFKVGDRVVPIELVNYTGTRLVRYDKYYFITELKGDRAVLCADRNGKKVVWAAMNTNNIKKV